MPSPKSSLNKAKADFTSLYNEDMPHAYFSAMRELGYQIPHHATKPLNTIINAIQQQRPGPVSVLDLGCSYGVLAALIRFRLSLDTLYQRYRIPKAPDTSMDCEISWYAQKAARRDVQFYGLDMSEKALDYATRIGLLETGLSVNLESPGTSGDALSSLPKQMDLMISTGCVGYITHVTFDKILRHMDLNQPPVLANFVLRAFDYSEISETLSRHGFRTIKLPGTTFVQRRFRDQEEQDRILALLAKQGAAELPENDGHFHAELFLSVHESARSGLLDELVQTLTS